MRLILLVLFIAIPLLEIAVFIQLGQTVGVLATILLVIVTAVVGTMVLHAQGFAVLQRANETMQRGAPPIEPVMEGILLLISGAFLLTPGLITDAVGAALLVPPLRQFVARQILKRALGGTFFDISVFGQSGQPDNDQPGFDREQSPFQRPGNRDPSAGETIIEGEFTRVDEHTVNPRRRGKP